MHPIIWFYIAAVVAIFGIGLLRMFIFAEDLNLGDIVFVAILAFIPAINFIVLIAMFIKVMDQLEGNYYWDGATRRFLRRYPIDE